MQLTVRQLIATLEGYPDDAVIAVEDLVDDQEFFIVSFQPGDGRLNIVISDKEEKETEEK